MRSLSLNKQAPAVTGILDLEEPEENMIIMNECTSDEIYSYGKHYYQEAQRILTRMP